MHIEFLGFFSSLDQAREETGLPIDHLINCNPHQDILTVMIDLTVSLSRAVNLDIGGEKALVRAIKDYVTYHLEDDMSSCTYIRSGDYAYYTITGIENEDFID